MHRTTGYLKNAIWIYFLLLIFEGGLRKWIFPGFASALLLVREPVALYILVQAYRVNLFPKNNYLLILSLVGIVSIFTTIFLGHGNLIVALFGARILLIQIPVLFVIGQVLDRSDILRIGKVMMMISIPMTILITMQFYSPQTAWVNKGVGNSLEGGGFSATADYFRPPGTFSFTTGVCLFFELTACFIFYFWLETDKIKKPLLILATVAFIIAIPTCISRALFFQAILSLLCFIVAKSNKPNFTRNLLQLVFGFSLLLIISLNVSFLNDQISAFTERFTTANEMEGGLNGVFVDRFLGGLLIALTNIDSKHMLWGRGIGMGTNVGSQLLTGDTSFLIAEQEWGRVMGESGLVLGLLIIAVRVNMTFTILVRSFRLFREGDYLAWMLLSLGFLILLQGGWSQPNNLGFYVLTGGLIMVSLKDPFKKLTPVQ